MFFRAGNEKTKTVEQTARADPHRLRGNIIETNFFDKRGRGGRGFQAGGNRGKGF